ncbi:MAG: hypothetical protein WCG01_01500 [bacterium]
MSSEKTKRKLVSDVVLPKIALGFFKKNPLAQGHLELDKRAKEILRKEGFVRTKNHTLLRVIK